MNRPVILVDRDIPWGIEAFESLGDVIPYGAGDLRRDPSILAEADILACRSVTRVDGALLSAAPRLRAVATPVVGRDHVVCEEIRAVQRVRGTQIEVFSAPGSTAAGVADWVVSAILTVMPDLGSRARPKVGIWGFGNCGRALAARLTRLGIRWVAYDPPLEAASAGAFLSASLQDLARCDVVTLHVPLTSPNESNWPTLRMVDTKVLDDLASGGVRLLCNTSRGRVIDRDALVARLEAGGGPALALDVYEGEPAPDPALIATPLIATAHVAGSVLEGRRNAIAKVREDVRRFLRLPPSPFPAEPAGGFDRPPPLAIHGRPALAEVRPAILAAVPLDAWTRTLRDLYLAAPHDRRGEAFDRARRGGIRREILWARLRRPH